MKINRLVCFLCIVLVTPYNSLLDGPGSQGRIRLPQAHASQLYPAWASALTPTARRLLSEFAYSRALSFRDGKRQRINTPSIGIQTDELPSKGTSVSQAEPPRRSGSMHRQEAKQQAFESVECCKPLSWRRSPCARSLCDAPAFARRPPPFSSSHPSRPSVAAPPCGSARPWIQRKCLGACLVVQNIYQVPRTQCRLCLLWLFLVLCAMFCPISTTSREKNVLVRTINLRVYGKYKTSSSCLPERSYQTGVTG